MSIYNATIKAKTAPASEPETPRTFVVEKLEAALPDEPELELPLEPEATAWMPKVVPVTTDVLPLVTSVVVTVAGEGVAVVDEQPDQVPVQELNGPQPAVHVVLKNTLVIKLGLQTSWLALTMKQCQSKQCQRLWFPTVQIQVHHCCHPSRVRQVRR